MGDTYLFDFRYVVLGVVEAFLAVHEVGKGRSIVAFIDNLIDHVELALIKFVLCLYHFLGYDALLF